LPADLPAKGPISRFDTKEHADEAVTYPLPQLPGVTPLAVPIREVYPAPDSAVPHDGQPSPIGARLLPANRADRARRRAQIIRSASDARAPTRSVKPRVSAAPARQATRNSQPSVMERTALRLRQRRPAARRHSGEGPAPGRAMARR
jgi:hypothetical protein